MKPTMLDVDQVWAAYRSHHPRAILAPERQRLIEKRLAEGYPADVLIAAIHGNHLDPHCNGENDRFKQYHSLGLILRDADHIERYAELAEAEQGADPVELAWDHLQAWVSTQGYAEALDMAAGIYPDEIVAELQRRVEGDVT